MVFFCSYQWDEDEREDWDGIIKNIIHYDNHYELYIESRSSIRVFVGKCKLGLYACIPDFGAGCYLSTLDDTFYNCENLIRAMENPVDGTTVGCALKALSSTLNFK